MPKILNTEMKLQFISKNVGFTTFYKTDLQYSWWEYNFEINTRGIFKIVHLLDDNCTREIRIGERVCFLMTGVSKDDAPLNHKYLSGKLNS
jgi:hypothetical protein